MFKEGQFYRHENTLDIDLYVVKVLDEDDAGTKIRVKFYNRHYNIFQPDIVTTEDVVVKPEQYINWRQVAHEKIN